MVITQNTREALKYAGLPGTFLNTSHKTNQNTAIIIYQKMPFYIHCWRPPEEVKQRTIAGQFTLLLKEKKNKKQTMVHTCCRHTCDIFQYISLTVDDLLSEELRHCYGLLPPSL